MSPITPSLLDQVAQALLPTSQASTSDKLSTVQTFATTLNGK